MLNQMLNLTYEFENYDLIGNIQIDEDATILFTAYRMS